MASSKNPIIRFVQEAFEELNKVTWPTKRQAFDLFLIVTIITLVVIAFITFFDWFFSSAYNLFL